MSPSAAPQEGVHVLVPVRGGAPDGLFNLRPSLEAPALERQRAQDLPPRLDQVQVGRVLRLEDELPARMGEREEQHIGRAVRMRLSITA